MAGTYTLLCVRLQYFPCSRWLGLGDGFPCFSFLSFFCRLCFLRLFLALFCELDGCFACIWSPGLPLVCPGGVPFGFGGWCRSGPWPSACSCCDWSVGEALCVSPSFSQLPQENKLEDVSPGHGHKPSPDTNRVPVGGGGPNKFVGVYKMRRQQTPAN